MPPQPSVLAMMGGMGGSRQDVVTPQILRGRISKVNMISGRAGNRTLQPTMTFDVVADAGNPTASTDGTIKDVIMLQAGFSSPSILDQAPGGIVYIPEVGSVAMIMHDGRRWVIIGFYTGPVQSARETSEDPEGLTISYNPGIELPMNRMNLQPGLDNTPHWAFAAEPGDAILSKGDARVKVNAFGAIIGANALAWSIYKSDGLVLERSVMREERMAGYQFRHFFHPGLQADAIATAVPGALAVVNPGAFFYQAEVLDTAPDNQLLKPYYLRQRGHVSGFDLYTGHQAALPLNTTASVAAETISKTFAVIRDAVVQPLSPVDTLTPGSELYPGRATSAEVYDYQVDAKGSVRLRAGNRSLVPGGQSASPTSEMDLSVEYNANTGAYSIRLGTAGAPAALVTIKALTPADAEVSVIAKDLKALLTGSATISAPQGIKLIGDVTVAGNLTVSGTAKTGPVTTPAATIGGIDFAQHSHVYVHPAIPDGASTTSPPK